MLMLAGSTFPVEVFGTADGPFLLAVAGDADDSECELTRGEHLADGRGSSMVLLSSTSNQRANVLDAAVALRDHCKAQDGRMTVRCDDKPQIDAIA
jgi:hypothetical protein